MIGDWRREVETNSGTMFALQRSRADHPLIGKDVQDEFKSYFVGEGELDWQYKMI